MSKPVRWGIIGTGRIATAFADDLKGVPGATLVAVASRGAERAARFAARHGAGRVHGDARQLAADPQIDLVYVASPPAAHREHALACIAGGKGVLVEKPFTSDAQQAREVIAAARAAGVLCMEAMWTRMTPGGRALAECLRRGELGEVRMIEASVGWPADPAGPAYDPQGLGGALLDLGVYPVSLAVWVLGRPTSVVASAAFTSQGVDSQVAALLGFAGGAQAVVAASIAGLLANRATITGTAARLELAEPFLRPERMRITHAPVPRGLAAAGGGRLAAMLRHPMLGRLRLAMLALRERSRFLPAAGHGYGHEAAEAMRAWAAREIESPLVTHDQTLAVLETLDAVRAACARAASGSGS